MESRSEIRIENPFTLKVGQVFTGFGIGCGIGIGVGRPLNLGRLFLFLYHSHMDFRRFFKPKTGQTSLNNPCIYLFIFPISHLRLLKLLIFEPYFIPCMYVGAIPVLDQVMSATRGATTAFSGVTRHLNTSVSSQITL